MVPGVSPVNALINMPVPVPFNVTLPPVITGFGKVLQQTPRAVTGVPPSAVTLPPPVAVATVIAVIVEVVTVGKAVADDVVVKIESAP